MTASTTIGRSGRSGRRRSGHRLAAVVLGVVCAACSIPSNDSAQPLENAPEDLLAVTTTIAGDPAVASEDTYEIQLYWHADQVVLGRIARSILEPPTPQIVLDQLLTGPTPEENAAKNPQIFQLDAALADIGLAPVVTGPDVAGVVTVTFASTTFRDATADKRNATAEMVCTLTELEGVTGIVVQDTQPQPIPLPDISTQTIDGPAMRANFNECAVPEPPPGLEVDETTSTSG